MQQPSYQNHKLDVLIRQRVVSLLREILIDTDFGLKLKPTVAKRLRKSVRSKKAGNFRSIEEITKKYQ